MGNKEQGSREFLESINRASIIINDKVKNPIKAVFEDNFVTISCETSMGKVSDSLTLDMTGEKVKIGFNNKYMTDKLIFCENKKQENVP